MKVKVFIYNGSPRNKSTGKVFALSCMRSLEEDYPVELSCDYYDGTTSHINPCFGCEACFSTGKFVCGNDDMALLRNKMLEADVVMFVSPVYIHGVTGTMKCFLDRIASWAHLMPLAGRFGINVSVSASNGNSYVNEFLHKVSDYVGLATLQDVAITNLSTLAPEDRTIALESYGKNTARLIYKVLRDKQIDKYITNNQDIIFDSNISLFAKSDGNGFEETYWKEIVNQGYSNFAEFFKTHAKERGLLV